MKLKSATENVKLEDIRDMTQIMVQKLDKL